MSKESSKTLGELIKEALIDKGLNQTAVAKKMNVSKQAINQIDRRKSFDLDFLQRLKAATDLDFTQHLYPRNFQNNQPVEANNEITDMIEMSLAIKLKSTPEQISRMGELLTSIRREAIKMGFTIM